MEMTRRFPSWRYIHKSMWKGYLLSIKGIRKGYIFCQNGKQKGKRLDFEAEPPGAKLSRVPPPPGNGRWLHEASMREMAISFNISRLKVTWSWWGCLGICSFRFNRNVLLLLNARPKSKNGMFQWVPL